MVRRKERYYINQRVIVEETNGGRGVITKMWESLGGDSMYEVKLDSGETIVRCEPWLTLEKEVRPFAHIEIATFYAFRHYRNGDFLTNIGRFGRPESYIRFRIGDRVLVLTQENKLDIDVIKEPMLLSIQRDILGDNKPGQREMDESDAYYLESVPFIGVFKSNLARPYVNIWYVMFRALEWLTVRTKRKYLDSADRYIKRIAKKDAIEHFRRKEETEIKDERH